MTLGLLFLPWLSSTLFGKEYFLRIPSSFSTQSFGTARHVEDFEVGRATLSVATDRSDTDEILRSESGLAYVQYLHCRKGKILAQKCFALIAALCVLRSYETALKICISVGSMQ